LEKVTCVACLDGDVGDDAESYQVQFGFGALRRVSEQAVYFLDELVRHAHTRQLVERVRRRKPFGIHDGVSAGQLRWQIVMVRDQDGYALAPGVRNGVVFRYAGVAGQEYVDANEALFERG
jgi:hypothetical protein